MQPGNRKLIKPKGDSHTISASLTKKGFTRLLLGSVGCTSLPTWA